MSVKKHHLFWTKFLKIYLALKNLTLAVHYDPQGQDHLAVLRHDPSQRQLIGFLIYPGSQMDFYDEAPKVMKDYFTLITPGELKDRFQQLSGKFVLKLFAATRRLKRYEYFLRAIKDSGFYLARRGTSASSWGIVSRDPEKYSIQFIAPFYRLGIIMAGVNSLDPRALIYDDVSILVFRLAMIRRKRFALKYKSR